MEFYPKYYAKTVVYGLIPGGFGYSRVLHNQQNPNYDIERDKHPVRMKHNGQTGWKKGEKAIQKRDYSDYKEYLTHQKQKYSEILQMNGGFSNRTIVTWRQRFYRRFRYLAQLLPRDAVILCLGARQGTEVEVLRDLGFHNAYGVDLNPGPDNPYVKSGDFMHLTEANKSIDCVYTNSIDHAFNLDDFTAEQVRVLKPTGFALYDLARYSGSRNPGAFEAIGWNSESEVINQLSQHYRKQIHANQEKKWHWVLFQGPIPN